MGIRFKCHHCKAALNIKEELALKRGICPSCKSKFRIPETSCDYSLPLNETMDSPQQSAKHTSNPKRQLTPAKPTTTEFKNVVTPKSASVSNKKPFSPVTAKRPPKNLATLSSPIVPDASPPQQVEAAHEVEYQYFVRPPSGGEYGPASKATIEEWITQRRVTADTLVCKLGTSEWLKAKDMFLMKFLFP